jgi:hypothetical protein
LGETELSALVERAFPVQKRVMEVLDVQLTGPKLQLLPHANRLQVALSLQTQERLLGRVAKGHLAFDSALRYEPSDASIRLVRVKVQSLGFDNGQAPVAVPSGSSSSSAALVQRLGLALAERGLEDLAIYHVTAERQASLRQLGLQPSAVTVTARGVEITLAKPAIGATS